MQPEEGWASVGVEDRTRLWGSPTSTIVVRGTEPPSEALLSRLPEEPGLHLVVVAARPPLPVDELTTLLAERLPVSCTAIRLVLSHAGSDGTARLIADRLRLTVTAARGHAAVLDSGAIL